MQKLLTALCYGYLLCVPTPRCSSAGNLHTPKGVALNFPFLLEEEGLDGSEFLENSVRSANEVAGQYFSLFVAQAEEDSFVGVTGFVYGGRLN